MRAPPTQGALDRFPPCTLQGVGKGTYSTRVSDAYGMMHIAAGDLVRAEIKRGSDLGKEVRPSLAQPPAGVGRTARRRRGRDSPPRPPPSPPAPAPCRPGAPGRNCASRPPQMAAIVNQGKLLPDAMILRAIREKFSTSATEGCTQFLLDGFPRTAPQAEALEQIANVQLALDLELREEVGA